MIPDNCWYGHRRVLADYCGLDAERPIYGSVRHGWSEGIPQGTGRQRLVTAPVFFWNSRHVAAAKRAGMKEARCVGAPFVYAVRNLGLDRRQQGLGTLVFNAHSADSHQVTHNLEELSQQVQEIAEPPFMLSVYYQDQSPVIAEWCAANDWATVTFGTRSDRLFLYRLAVEMSRHSTIITQGFQSASWYSAYLGRNVRVLPKNDSAWGNDLSVDRQAVYEKFRHGISGSLAITLGAEELGDDYVLPPAELSQALGWDAALTRVAARVFGLAVDLRHGTHLREGYYKGK